MLCGIHETRRFAFNLKKNLLIGMKIEEKRPIARCYFLAKDGVTRDVKNRFQEHVIDLER